MTVDLASLAIRVESLEAVTAERRLRGLEKQGRATETATDQLSKAAKKLAAAFGGLLVARKLISTLSDISATTAKFEASVSELSAITGATGKDLDFLSDKAKEFGRTTTLSASQAAEAFKLVASAKPDLLESGEALAQVTQNAIVLAEATGSSLPEAADTLGSALNQFGAGAEEAERFINVLAAGAQRGASFVNETAEALKYAGTVAASVGVSFETTNAAIQQLSTVGIKASEAGTAIRNTLLKLEGQTESRFKPSVVGMVQAFANLRDSQKSLTELTELFGLRSVVAANNLIQNADAVKVLEDKITDTSTAYEQQKTKVDNLEGSIKQLKSAQEGLAISIGEELNPVVRGLVDVLTASTNAYTSYRKEAGYATDGSTILETTLRILIRALFLISEGFQTVGEFLAFFVRQVVTGAGFIKDVLGGAFTFVFGLFEQFKIGISIAGIELREFGESVVAFAQRSKAILSGDFELAGDIKRAREENAAASEAEIDALKARSGEIDKERKGILGTVAADMLRRTNTLNQQEQEFIGLQKLRAEEISLFIARTDAGYKAEEQSAAAIEKKKQELALAEEVEKQLQRQAEIADNETAISGVAEKYATDLEAAQKNADDQIALLQNLNNLTAEQETARAETIKRIRAELADFIAEEDEKKKEEIAKNAKAELDAEILKQNTINEFRVAAAESAVEAEEIRHEARMEALMRRGEQQGVTQELIDAAVEKLERDHQINLDLIRIDSEKRRQAQEEKLNQNRLKGHMSFLAQLTAGTAQNSRTMFDLNKAAAIAEGALNIPSAASKAYEFGSKFGPFVGAAYAALAVAAEIAQLNAIKNTKFDGGGGGTTPSAAGTTPVVNGNPVSSGSNDDLLNPPNTNDASQEGARNQVIVTGNIGFTPSIIDQIADGLRDATNERDVIIFEEGSRQAQDIQVSINGAS